MSERCNGRTAYLEESCAPTKARAGGGPAWFDGCDKTIRLHMETKLAATIPLQHTFLSTAHTRRRHSPQAA